MEKKLLQMFPEGQWGTGQKAWMVKDGVYFCAAADIVDGEVVLTELGHRLLGATPPEKASAPAEVVIPELAEEVVAPELVKKTGQKAKHG